MRHSLLSLTVHRAVPGLALLTGMVLTGMVLAGSTVLFRPVAARAEKADGQGLHQKIDRLIHEAAQKEGVPVAPLADDAEFLRRAYLDLNGTVPGPDRTREFLKDDRPDKRERLIDELLAQPAYARHMAQTLDVQFMMRLRARAVKEEQWQAFLRQSFAENTPWDQFVRDIVSADGTDQENRGAARFYLDRDEAEINAITRAISRKFLGADLECAQCHDDPSVGDWKQEDYFGIQAFLVRTSYADDAGPDNQPALKEEPKGEVSFESVFEIRDGTSPGAQTTLPKLFDGPEFPDPEDKEERQEYSRLARLADALTAQNNRRFARSAANRFWAHLMGRGIVHPIDQDHSDNPPSHPELLDALTDAMIEMDFDLQRYLKAVMLSDTYQRSSRLEKSPAGETDGDGSTEDGPGPETFARAILKPLTPKQLSEAVLVVTGEKRRQIDSLKDKYTEEALEKRLSRYRKSFVKEFAAPPGELPEKFEATASEALFLLNDNSFVRLTAPRGDNLTRRLMKLPEDDHEAVADELFITTLARRPRAQEVDIVEECLAGLSGNDRRAVLEDLVWAAITSAEFRFNH